MIEPRELFAYVRRPDPAFRWEVRSETRVEKGTATELRLVSQVWQTIVWSHTLIVFVPDNARNQESALLYITGLYNGSLESHVGALLAHEARTITAFLYDVPNQPLFDELYEDGLIAHTFVRYLETGDADWPLLFPMAKSAVRAMDALQQWSARNTDTAIARFLVTGASKRGWTTWLSAVVDSRVQAILPMVYDNLNLPAQMRHQIEAWGDYSRQIDDYTEQNLPATLQTAEGRHLAKMIDPYTYRDRLTLPKLIVNGTNDAYWTQDALNQYWGDLAGPKSILYVPNSGHGLEDLQRVVDTVAAFVRTQTSGHSFPEVTWKFAETADCVTLEIASDTPAEQASLWQASAATQDFRQSEWTRRPMREEASGCFAGSAPKTSGSLAVFGEIEFRLGGRLFTLSTQIRIHSSR